MAMNVLFINLHKEQSSNPITTELRKQIILSIGEQHP